MGQLDLRQYEYKQHGRELLHEAELQRLAKQGRQAGQRGQEELGGVGHSERAQRSFVRHAISRVGSWLVLLGTKLERVEPA